MVHLPPPMHGAAAMGARLVEGALARRFRLHVVPLRFARGLGDLGRPGGRKLLIAIRCGLAALRALAFGRVDAAYITPGAKGPAMARDAGYMHLFRLFRVPYVAHLHVMGLPDRLDAAPRLVRRWVGSAYRGAAAVITLNGAHMDEMTALVDAGRIAVVPNGVPDLPEPPGPPGPPEPGRHGFAGGDRGRRLLFLSNMLEEKGPFVLLEALPRILAASPGLRPTFAGAWPDGAAETRFRARARALGVAERIEITGPVDEPAKLALLAEAAVFVFPSYYPLEGTPLVVAEAMRQGLPIVASRHAGVPEMLGDRGLLVPPRDPDALAAAVERVLGDPELARSLGVAARDGYEDGFRIERWEDQVAGVLRRAART